MVTHSRGRGSTKAQSRVRRASVRGRSPVGVSNPKQSKKGIRTRSDPAYSVRAEQCKSMRKKEVMWRVLGTGAQTA